MSENTIFDALDAYIKSKYVEEAIDFVCDQVTEHTQDDLDDPFTILSESVSCRPVSHSDPDHLDEEEVTEPFHAAMLRYMREKGIENDAELYSKIPVDQKLLSKIRNNPDFVPVKNLVILLGLGLELNREEMDSLLKSARYRLSRSRKEDLVIAFCTGNGIYDIKLIDRLLDDQELPLISQRI